MQGVDITIQFDHELFQLENVTFIQDELANSGYNLMYNQVTGNITIASYAMMNLTNIEEFIELEFSILESEMESGEIQITNFIFNEMISESGFELLDDFGNSIMTDHVIINIVNLDIENNVLPQSYKLYQNKPNPFNPVTEISFDLPKATYVTIEIYDITGDKVIQLVKNMTYIAGHHKIKWDASNNPGGIYFYRIITDDFQKTNKMILIK